MAILHSCCCWNNVRSGSLASGIYTLILSLVNGGLVGYNLVMLRNREIFQDQQDMDEPSQMQPMQMAHDWLLSTLVVCILLFITSITCIIAVHKDNRYLLIPWVGVTILTIAVDTAVLIYQCVVFGLLTFNIIQMVIWLGLTLLNIYCVLCVISQYQELSAGRGTLQYLREQGATIIYRPGIQQVHIAQGPIVMTCPGTMTSVTEVQNNPQGEPSVRTTVLMSPPDYSVATSQLPSYASHEEDSADHDSEKTLLDKKCDPPPYYP